MKKTDSELMKKYNSLKERIAAMESAAVAFSGGIDSALLLYAAKEALGKRAVAVTASTCLNPARETEEARDFCRMLGVRQVIAEPDILRVEGFAENPENRCYLCKRALLRQFLEIAEREGAKAVIEGSNLDDDGDYRPGMAAVRELGIRSPLKECGFTKEEIRLTAKMLGIPFWDKPSFACLASRIPYGDRISREKLRMAERAEQLLYELGFHQFRVRVHGDLARVEILPEEFGMLMEEKTRKKIGEEFRSIGFAYTALDIRGFRTGSMNENLSGYPGEKLK